MFLFFQAANFAECFLYDAKFINVEHIINIDGCIN